MTARYGHDQAVPIYDYACASCETTFEELARSDAPPPPCPTCGTEETKRLLSSFLTPNMASGQRRFQRDIGSAMAPRAAAAAAAARRTPDDGPPPGGAAVI